MRTQRTRISAAPQARGLRPWGLVAALLLCVTLPGCGRPAGVIFPPIHPPITWPPQLSDGPARIRYVGQLATSEDLQPPVSGGQAFGEALFGRESARSMLTPFALCADGKDRLFVADSNAQCVHVFNFNTREYQRWVTPRDGPQFAQPVAVAYDPVGRVIVADSVFGGLFVFDDQGNFQSVIGRQSLQRPCGLTIHPTTRQLFVTDAGLHQLLILAPDGTLMAKLGQRGPAPIPANFNFPTSVAISPDGTIYVCDALNFRIQVFNPDLTFARAFGTKGDVPGSFSQPKALATDSDGHLYVIDSHFEAVEIFDPQGRVLLSFGEEGRAPGQFWLPTGIFIDAHNRIYIADSYNRRVQVFDYLPAAGPVPTPASDPAPEVSP
ncbi:MAG: 6-bladed beta-propeller [Phycisphaerales bacterium]